ncbi:PaaI family thioesterase [Paracoccus sp. M683]|uniref:PaaI family thioesterase n=1 Tax=Paracoccus sp. M683 TaxID=2594268 RepID=UPI0011815AF5|nr:PaaI family thioesterase [Paracoccus sp. M683]TRW99697.1 PaaI family thioesterase [Paracoccus sp. M683]
MTEYEQKSERAQQAQQFMQALPYARALDMRVDDIGNGSATISMPWADHLVGDPHTGVIHGGVVSALMDTCCGAAVLGHPAVKSATATLDLRIDYMRAAKPGQRLRARAECYHLTRSVAFVRAVTTDEDSDNPVATATGAFTIEVPTNG